LSQEKLDLATSMTMVGDFMRRDLEACNL
jgi:hypothetical protein